MERHRLGGDAGPTVGEDVRQVDDLEALDDGGSGRASMVTGRVCREGDAAGRHASGSAPSTTGGLDLGRAGAPRSPASRTMKMKGVHCQTSPIVTAKPSTQGVATQAKSARPKRGPERVERTLARVGKHAGKVGHADGGDHHRQEKDDAKEAPAG